MLYSLQGGVKRAEPTIRTSKKWVHEGCRRRSLRLSQRAENGPGRGLPLPRSRGHETLQNVGDVLSGLRAGLPLRLPTRLQAGCSLVQSPQLQRLHTCLPRSSVTQLSGQTSGFVGGGGVGFPVPLFFV